mgnify:CR=1 FL=1
MSSFPRKDNALKPARAGAAALRGFMALAVLLVLMAEAALAESGDRFISVDDGQAVLDSATGLVWRRCNEGQTYSAGSCQGDPVAYSFDDALDRAKSQGGWRIPNVKELFSLAEFPRANAFVLPSTSEQVTFWSITPSTRNNQNVWVVRFGETTSVFPGSRCAVDSSSCRRGTYSLRLVRIAGNPGE